MRAPPFPPLSSPPLPAPARARTRSRALAARGRSTRRRLCLPLAQGRSQYAQPSSNPFSPDEDRRRPAFPLSIFSSSCGSCSYSRCHLKTLRPGGGRGRGEGVKKSQESVNRACARAVVGPQTGNQSPLPPPPEITFWEPVFFCGLPHEVLFLGVRFFFFIVSAPMTK